MTLEEMMELLRGAIKSGEDRGHDPLSYETGLRPDQFLFDHTEQRVEVDLGTKEGALQALMEIPCKIDPKGCDGPWCSARAALAKAFNVEVVVPVEGKKEE